MADVDTKARRAVEERSAAITPAVEPAPRAAPPLRLRIFPLLITLVTVAKSQSCSVVRCGMPIWAPPGRATAQPAPTS
jgi:hypothetical protein